ncbi:MAG: peptidylprolyl isomerase [bacterium]|nr:peptidylprolyl isomerase [bacterium]
MPTETIGNENTEKKNDDQPEILSNTEIREICDRINNIKALPVKDDEIAVLETSMGTIKFKFFPDAAPNHCASFKKLANNGFYDGTLFHRVAINFVIQGGDIFSRNDDPSDDGSGDPGFNLDAEFSDISHKRGVVSTARQVNDVNTGNSQFFIMHANHPRLNQEYSVFGEVIEGIEVLDEIAEVPVRLSRPLDPVYLKKARVVRSK